MIQAQKIDPSTLVPVSTVKNATRGQRAKSHTVETAVEQEDGSLKFVHLLPEQALANCSVNERAQFWQKQSKSTKGSQDKESLLGLEQVAEKEEGMRERALGEERLEWDELTTEQQEVLSAQHFGSFGVEQWARVEAVLWLLEDKGPKDAYERQQFPRLYIPNNLHLIGYSRDPFALQTEQDFTSLGQLKLWQKVRDLAIAALNLEDVRLDDSALLDLMKRHNLSIARRRNGALYLCRDLEGEKTEFSSVDVATLEDTFKLPTTQGELSVFEMAAYINGAINNGSEGAEEESSEVVELASLLSAADVEEEEQRADLSAGLENAPCSSVSLGMPDYDEKGAMSRFRRAANERRAERERFYAHRQRELAEIVARQPHPETREPSPALSLWETRRTSQQSQELLPPYAESHKREQARLARENAFLSMIGASLEREHKALALEQEERAANEAAVSLYAALTAQN